MTDGRPVASEADVRQFVLGRLTSEFAARGLDPDALDDSFDLLIEGVIDSFGIVELVVALEERYGFELDFSGLDADDLTRIGPLSRYVEEQAKLGGATPG